MILFPDHTVRVYNKFEDDHGTSTQGSLVAEGIGSMSRPRSVASDRTSTQTANVIYPQLLVTNELGQHIETGSYVEVTSKSGNATLYIASEVKPIEGLFVSNTEVTLEATA